MSRIGSGRAPWLAWSVAVLYGARSGHAPEERRPTMRRHSRSMEPKVAPDERFEQLRLGESLEATDEEVQTYVSRLLESKGVTPAEPDWLRDLLGRPPRDEATEE